MKYNQTLADWFMEYHLAAKVNLNTSYRMDPASPDQAAFAVALARVQNIAGAGPHASDALVHMPDYGRLFGASVMLGVYTGIMVLGHLVDGHKPFVLTRAPNGSEYERLWALQKPNGVNAVDQEYERNFLYSLYQLTL